MSKMLVDLVDEQELNDLRAHYGKFCLQHEDLAMEPGSLDFYRRAFKNRRGEILFVLRRDNGDVWYHLLCPNILCMENQLKLWWIVERS